MNLLSTEPFQPQTVTLRLSADLHVIRRRNLVLVRHLKVQQNKGSASRRRINDVLGRSSETSRIRLSLNLPTRATQILTSQAPKPVQ